MTVLMCQKELMELLRSTVQDVAEHPLAEVDPDTPISEMGIDSISLAEIVVRLEDKLGLEILATEWLAVNTLQDFLDAIKQAQERASSTRRSDP